MKILVDSKEIRLPEGVVTINDLLGHMGRNREEVVVVVNGEITIEENPLHEGDSLKLISAVSGG